jgi:hypothetical protein
LYHLSHGIAIFITSFSSLPITGLANASSCL